MFDPVIIGLGETQVGSLPGYTQWEIQAEAARRAVHDAGLEKGDVDGLINSPPYSRPHQMFSLEMSEYLGLRPKISLTMDIGGTATALTMVETASLLLRDGRCNVVVVVFGDNMRTGRPPRLQGNVRMAARRGSEEWEEPFGIVGMVIPYAMMANRYMHLYGATKQQFGAVAVAARNHALRNPNAQMRTPLTMDEYLNAPPTASPFGRWDCSLVSDGGGAIVLTTRRYAAKRGLKQTPVHILGCGSQTTHKNISQIPPDIGDLPLKPAVAAAYERSGMSAKDLDVASVHDAFTLSTLLGVEALGLCAEGEGGAFAAAGDLEPGAAVPINPHGGLLSQAHVGGILHVVEVARQVRGDAGERQVPDARIGAVLGNGGVYSVAACMLLARG